MLTKEQYKELSKNWSKHGTVYQKYDRYQVRFPMLLKHIDVFKDKDVLEVGSNAGLAAYHIAQVAKSYTGVEGEKGYWNQSLETQKQIESKNTDFKNMSIKTYIKRAARGDFEINVNAAYLSYVLYHFSDKEVSMFEKNILPKLDVIVVQSRYENRNKKGRTTHNSYKFWMPKSVEKYLIKNGFSTTVEYGPRNKFHFIIGKRDDSKYPLLLNSFLELSDAKLADKKMPKASELVQEDNKVIKRMLTEGKVPELPLESNKIYKKYEKRYKELEKDKKYLKYLKEVKEEDRNEDLEIIKELSNECSEHLVTGDIDGDKGRCGKHSKGTRKSSSRQGASNRQKRTSKGVSFDDTKREADPTREGQTVLPKRRRGRRPSVLLDGVEKSSKDKVRSKDVQKTKQTSRSRAVSTSRKDNKSKNKSAVQEHEAQS